MEQTRTKAGCGRNQVIYMLDSLGGSRGAPVLSYKDNVVVIALHHCRGCDTTGTNSGVDGRSNVAARAIL